MPRRITLKDRAALALGIALCASGCSFATLGRVTEGGRDADSSKLSQIAIERAGRVVPAAPSMSLEKGDTITTGPDVSVSISFAGADVLLMPKTKVTLGSIWTWFGEVFVSGWLTSDSKLATAGVEGTEYVFKVDPETSETTITVLEGKVRAKSKTASWPERELTRAQQLRIAESDTAPPEPVTLDRDAFNALLTVSNLGRTVFQDSLVPDVQGLPRDEAERQLKALELRVSTRTTPVTDDAQVDRVISQKPEAGVRSRSVELRIGVRAVPVPDLSGISLDEARTRIEGAGLRVGGVTTKDAGQDRMPGTVLSQDPRAGAAVERDSRVELVVQAEASSAVPEAAASSAAPEAAPSAPADRVPHVIGLAPPAALASLAAAGLQAIAHETLEAGRTSAVVMDQNPGSDSPKPASGTVELKISLPGVQVPDLFYVPASEIDARVADKGLTIQRSERWVPEGTARDQSVSSQSIPAGQLVPRGSVLNVVIDRVITTCAVPDVSTVVGGYETEAEVRSRVEAAIREAGMPPNVTIVPGTGDMWIIRSQSPKPGQRVDCRTPVVVQITRILG